MGYQPRHATVGDTCGIEAVSSWVESLRVAGPGVSFDPVDDLPNPA